MQPHPLEASRGEMSSRCASYRGCAFAQDLAYVDATNGRALHIAISIIGVEIVALANLHDVRIANEDPPGFAPSRKQRFAAAGGKSQVHPCRGSQARIRV